MRQGAILSFHSCHCFPTSSPLLAFPALPFASLLNRVPPGQGVLRWDVQTHLVVLNTAPELKKQLCPTMNQPNLLFPLNPSMPAQPCCRLHNAERQSCHVSRTGHHQLSTTERAAPACSLLGLIMGCYSRSGVHTKLALEGETQKGVKGRNHACRTPKHLMESCLSKCC